MVGDSVFEDRGFVVASTDTRLISQSDSIPYKELVAYTICYLLNTSHAFHDASIVTKDHSMF